MEERIQDSPAVDRDATLQAIDYARRQIVGRIEPAELAPGAMERHIADNTADDGTYPWTAALPELALPESNASDDRQLPAASQPETKSDENSG
jgi:hypothetical protein